MMIRFPKKVTIGGYKIPVIFVDDFAEESDLLGLFNSNLLTITLKRYDNRSHKRTAQTLCETLLHESIHAVDTIYNQTNFSEDTVYKLSKLLYNVLVHNDLKLDSDEMPKYLDISGDVVLIKYPYIFKDTCEEFLYRLDVETQELRLSKYFDSSPLGEQKIKSLLVKGVITALLMTKFFDDLDFEESQLDSFCEGMYQFLKENKINELARRCYNERIV